jgi:glycosyltransferase involved in cell wall biosynthesis
LKVAIIGTRGYPSFYGGFETAVRKLAPYLADHGWEVTVYGRSSEQKPEKVISDSRINVVTTWGIESTSLSTITHGFSATVHAARTKPDVALVMNVANGFFLPMLKFKGIPTLVNVDGIEWDRAKWGPVAKKVFKFGARLTARFADLLVSDSQEISRRWNEIFSRESIFIPYGGEIPSNGVEAPIFPRRGYVLLVARFVPENSITEFLSAAKILSSHWDVVIVGSGGKDSVYNQQVELLSRSNSKIHWLGHVRDDLRLLGLWRDAGVYFHGHSVGGTNPALVQAMAAGSPIVARDTAYNREVLGDSAIFVEPEGPSIAQAIDQLMRNPILQKKLSSRASARASNHYSWEEVCANYEKALLSLLEKKS